ncbi:hypothetical protein N656DRAFT_845551 [Canariomyces notabilis]|uniref:Zn(2)-C6 fungal-type domain-containing protein n=1 Tax=Canariomyces notabilis TaxID=2074819 RepID=A0AAN6TD62_9PEZI|nr:hypothetical protein N656DRAFT_845551 [Canariomyces arenarius]
MPARGKLAPTTACDRCHSLKTKCVYESMSTPLKRPLTCTRCMKLGKPCSNSRSTPKLGRPRKADASTSLLPRPWAEFVWIGTQDEGQKQPEQSPPRRPPAHSPMAPSAALADPRSWPSNRLLANRSSEEMRLLQAMFDRERPSFMCCFVIGPSFAEAALAGLLTTLAQFPEAADALLSGFLACSRRVFALMETATTQASTSATGSSTQHQPRPGMITATSSSSSSSSSTANLKRSLSASAEADYAYSAKAVKALRDRSESSSSMADDSRQATKPSNKMDQVLTMVLGLGVLTFDLLDSGLNAHSICRCTLGLIGPEYPMEAQEKVLPLIYMDTCNCLVRRQIPVHRLGTGEMGRVDRYIGLCLSLLPIMYDLCCITTCHGQPYMNAGRGVPRQGQGDDVQESLLDVVKKTVQEWKPPLARMADTAKLKLTQKEVQVIATQAAVYRSAILLFIHRLRLAFAAEEDDMEANFMASSILDDIRSLYRSSSDSSTGSVSASLKGEGWTRDETWLFEYRMGLPFLIAAVELQDKTQRVQALDLLQWVVCKRMYPQVGDRLRQFILFVWEARDHGFGGHWIDLTAHGPQFVLF